MSNYSPEFIKYLESQWEREFGSPKPKGRPLDKDRAKSFEATKPWLAEGMSRRTWYRRQAQKRAGK